MAELALCMMWNDHANELATVCKSLLEKDFLVDCTVAAEGGSLKAHRLILSASSPYFHMLFSEEREKYPIVILKDTPFVTLKTVIDFVYNGKAEIPENQLEAFLDLAKSLQIKGLNNTFRKNRKTDVGGNAHQCAIVNEDDCGTESTPPSYKDNFSNSSRQHEYHHPHDCTDTADTVSSVPLERCSDSCKKVQSGAVVIPPQNHQSCSMYTDREEFIIPEICVKHEPLDSEIEFFETKIEVVDDAEQDEPTSKSLESGMNNMPASTHENILDQFSCGRESLDENGSSASVTPLQQQPHHYPSQLQQPHVTNLPCELVSAPEAEQRDPLLTERLEIKSEKTDDAESEESTSAHIVTGKDADEHDEGTELTFERTLSRCSGAEGPALAQEPPMQQRRRCPQQSGASFIESSDLATHKPKHRAELRSYPCDECGKIFTHQSGLDFHKRKHTGESPYQCDVCGKIFAHQNSLDSHKRTHTGDYPYSCFCGKAFKRSRNFSWHMRMHMDERSYPCDVCGKGFNHASHLASHKRSHTRESRNRGDPVRSNVNIFGDITL